MFNFLLIEEIFMLSLNPDFYVGAHETIRSVRSTAPVLIREIRNNENFKLLESLADYIEKRLKTVDVHSVNSLLLRINFVRELKGKMVADGDLSRMLAESNIEKFNGFFGHSFYDSLVKLGVDLNYRSVADNNVQDSRYSPMRLFAGGVF
jgi:hypothetical protein